MKKLAILAAVALTAGGMGIASAIATDTSFAAADANKDGGVTFVEAQALFPTLTQEQFNAADTNGDGKLEEGEYGAIQGLQTNNNGPSSNVAPSSSSSM
jgi:hypothetical protein